MQYPCQPPPKPHFGAQNVYLFAEMQVSSSTTICFEDLCEHCTALMHWTVSQDKDRCVYKHLNTITPATPTPHRDRPVTVHDTLLLKQRQELFYFTKIFISYKT